MVTHDIFSSFKIYCLTIVVILKEVSQVFPDSYFLLCILYDGFIEELYPVIFSLSKKYEGSSTLIIWSMQVYQNLDYSWF